ncbi:hypothetical protein Areg01_85090 [Actinoplanes regularis]|nr:hypothetical protein Areg01_85090 [Actinoplanes regularis]
MREISFEGFATLPRRRGLGVYDPRSLALTTIFARVTGTIPVSALRRTAKSERTGKQGANLHTDRVACGCDADRCPACGHG